MLRVPSCSPSPTPERADGVCVVPGVGCQAFSWPASPGLLLSQPCEMLAAQPAAGAGEEKTRWDRAPSPPSQKEQGWSQFVPIAA